MRASDQLRMYRGAASLCDGSGFTPAALADLMLWLRADMGLITTLPNAGKVVSWADQSGFGRDFAQGADASRPAFVAASANFAGQPTIQSSGSPIVLPSASAILGGNNAITFFVAYRETSGAIIAEAGPSFPTAGGFLLDASGVNLDAYTYGATGSTARRCPAAALTKWYVAAVFNYSAVATNPPLIYLNSVLQSTTAITNTGTNGTSQSLIWNLFNRQAGGAPLIGEIAEIIAVARVMSAAEIAQVYAYQLARFG